MLVMVDQDVSQNSGKTGPMILNTRSITNPLIQASVKPFVSGTKNYSGGTTKLVRFPRQMARMVLVRYLPSGIAWKLTSQVIPVPVLGALFAVFMKFCFLHFKL